jgi:hypothetical protein
VSSPPEVRRGVRVLRRLLREQVFDLRELDAAGFRDWLNRHLARWRRDPVFAQRARIRDLRRAHPELRAFENEHRGAAAADAASPQFARLEHVERDLTGTARAISGLSAALKQAGPEKRSDLRRKLREFRVKQQALRRERTSLVRSSPERLALQRSEAGLRRLRGTIGLDREQARLEQFQKERGRRFGRSGSGFERTALAVTQAQVIPDLLRSRGPATAARVRVLQGVTLGAARIEFDQLVVRLPRRQAAPVEVLAVVEVKRNPNDLAHGFRRRQADLRWLTGDDASYEARSHRTRQFPSGHFDREALHHQDGESFLFDRSSFRRLHAPHSTTFILDRLYFITRAGPLWGLSTAALSRISFRVSTDEDWDAESEVCLRKLLRWCRSLAQPLETPDVFALYAATPRSARQVVLIHP